MIYEVSINGKRGLGYVPPKSYRVKPNSKQKEIKPKALYSNSLMGTHMIILHKNPGLRKNLGELTKNDQKDMGT